MRLPDRLFWLLMRPLPRAVVDLVIEEDIRRFWAARALIGRPRIGSSRDPERWYRGRRTDHFRRKPL